MDHVRNVPLCAQQSERGCVGEGHPIRQAMGKTFALRQHANAPTRNRRARASDEPGTSDQGVRVKLPHRADVAHACAATTASLGATLPVLTPQPRSAHRHLILKTMQTSLHRSALQYSGRARVKVASSAYDPHFAQRACLLTTGSASQGAAASSRQGQH